MANSVSNFSDKLRLRQSIREQLKRLSLDDRRRRSVLICDKLVPLLTGKKIIGLFAPRSSEPDLDLLWDSDLMNNRIFAYPWCDSQRMLFFAVCGLEELHPGKFGVREPDPKQIVERLDAIVLPGLAFTETGTRIGQGAGFYDRFLEIPSVGTVKIGVCFDFQVIKAIPREEHDVNVDLLVYA